VKAQNFPWWTGHMMNEDVVNIINTADMPPEAAAEKAFLQQHNIKSVGSMTITYKNNILGTLFFTSEKDSRVWQEDHKELLQILANLLKDALIKVEAEKEITYLAFYDGLTGLPNRTLFKNRWNRRFI
jgi:GAF domain-containing protein